MEPKWKVINFLNQALLYLLFSKSRSRDRDRKGAGGIELRRSVERYAKESKIQNYNSKTNVASYTRALKIFETQISYTLKITLPFPVSIFKINSTRNDPFTASMISSQPALN